MNRLAVSAIALAVAAGPASAESAYRHLEQAPPTLGVAAGNVNADGTVQRGTGFRVTRLGPGEYEIRFAHGYFSSGCAAMTVEGTSAFNILSNASQKRCPQRQPAFRVNTYDAGSGLLSDESFQFVAVEENL